MSNPARTQDQARAEAQKILNRAKSDPGFLEQLKTQPVEALQAAGLSLPEAKEFSQELRQEDVPGYFFCGHTCDIWSCWVTACGYIPWTS